MLSGSAYIQMMKEIDDMINHNNFDMSSIMLMPPFEFKAYRRNYIDKHNNKQ
jgi:hypothetical protein